MNEFEFEGQLGLPFAQPWTDYEKAVLAELYSRASDGPLNLARLAIRFGRDKANVCRKARELGLTNQERKKVLIRKSRPLPKYATQAERGAALGAMTRARYAAGGHPRGALGMRHTQMTKELIAGQSRDRWAAMTQEQRDDHVFKAVKARRAQGIPFATSGRGSWKAAWREVGDQRCYFRSRWEANYARYLEWLRSIGQIAKWEHEPHTFWFEGIKRGCVSYLPDFRVTENGGAIRWHEVKGWMDARSKTTLDRMARYHPNEVLIVIREAQYNEIKRKVSTLIPGWES